MLHAKERLTARLDPLKGVSFPFLTLCLDDENTLAIACIEMKLPAISLPVVIPKDPASSGQLSILSSILKHVFRILYSDI